MDPIDFLWIPCFSVNSIRITHGFLGLRSSLWFPSQIATGPDTDPEAIGIQSIATSVQLDRSEIYPVDQPLSTTD